MTDDKKHLRLRIERLPDGGFMVSEASAYPNNGRELSRLLASSTIGEALSFIARRLDPNAYGVAKPPAASPDRRCSMCGTCGRGVGVSKIFE